MSGTSAPQPEPQWPTYVPRTDQWDPYDPVRAACGCRTLEVLWQQDGFFGAVALALGRCLECGGRWEYVSPLYDAPTS